MSVFTATIFGIADPTTGAANQAVVDAAICVMLNKPVPANDLKPVLVSAGAGL